MSDLKVDYDRLGELVQHLDAGLAAMGAEDDTSNQIADAAGDGALAAKIRSFGSSWEFHRQLAQHALGQLKSEILTIHDQLESIDRHLAAGLVNGSSTPTSTKTA